MGWLNAGADIVVHGNTANGAANAMAQGKIYVAGNAGAARPGKQHPPFGDFQRLLRMLANRPASNVEKRRITLGVKRHDRNLGPGKMFRNRSLGL